MLSRPKEIGIIIGTIGILITIAFVPLYLNKRNQDARSSAAISSKKMYAIGDSITFGHRDCVNGVVCELEPDTYLSNYANTRSARDNVQFSYHNLAYSGTAVQGSLSNTSFQNAYKDSSLSTPDNQASIQKSERLTNKREGGEARAKQGEFDNITNSTVIMAYGRNDVSKSKTVESFKASYEQLLKRVNNSNERIILTVPPMSYNGWRQYMPTSSPITNYPYAIDLAEYPTELDSFYSSQLWELASQYGAKIVPVHEHFMLNPQDQTNYFSSDQIHPSKSGHKIISNLMLNETSNVYRKDISSQVPVNKLFTIKPDNARKTYGHIVYYNQGKFLASTPFMINPGQSYTVENIGTQTAVYTTQPSSINRVNDNAQPGIFIRQQISPLNDRIAVAVQGLQSIPVQSVKFYIGPRNPSGYCSPQSPWKEVRGRFFANTFLFDQSIKNIVGNNGDYIVIMNYSSGDKIVTGNPGGNCNLGQFVSKPGLNASVNVVK
jgi:lysophospholipase L1-like esterase